MKSPNNQQTKQALNEDSISLSPPRVQTGIGSAEEEGNKGAGNVPGHGGSMSVQHGFPSPNPLDVALTTSRQSAADMIRQGSSLSASQPSDTTGINSNAPLQVTSIGMASVKEKRTSQQRGEDMDKVLQAALETETRAGGPFLSAIVQKYKADQDLKGKEWLEKESAVVKNIGQRVLSMTFCLNRLAEMSRLAGNTKLSDSYHEVNDIQLFKKFQRENESGDPPYYCVTADIMGRALHTFKEEYVTNSTQRRIPVEFDLHVHSEVEAAKEAMSSEAVKSV
jgi:hypothetical protein